MKEFEKAELEVIEFESDVVVASCSSVICGGNSCACHENIQCTQVTA